MLMSVSQPSGYRLPATVGLTALSRALISDGRSLRRDESVVAVAIVAAELFVGSQDPDAVLRRLSHGQLSGSDLTLSTASGRGLVSRAAEFVDLAHVLTHRPGALPMPTRLDLRFSLQFFDDPDDSGPAWTYVLVGTNSDRLEQAWLSVDGVEAYPVTVDDQPPLFPESDPEWAKRAIVWDRVLAPYAHAQPITWAASEPQLFFDVTESLAHPERDQANAADGRLTVPLVVEQVRQLLDDPGHGDRSTLTAALTRPLAVSGAAPLG
jgi:hypothetical protein